MEEIKILIRMIVLILGLFLYIGVWGYLWKNRDRCCEKYINDFLWTWVFVHISLVLIIIAWAFS